MKKFRTAAIVFFMLFFTVVSVQAEVLNSLKFTANSGTVSSSGGTYTLTDFTERATMQADISDAVRKAVGENGGSVTVSCRVSVKLVNGSGQNITMSLSGTGSSSSTLVTENTLLSCTAKISAEQLDRTVNLVFTNIDPEKISQISIRAITITGEPAEATPTVSPTPTGGTEATPTPTPTEVPTPSASSTAPATPDPTAKATPRPTTAYESTHDTWTDNKVTNAPPTPAIDIGDIGELATPVAEITPEPQEGDTMPSGNQINKGLIILFAVLLVLLGADIAAIFIRKRYAPAALSAGADSVHRSIKEEDYEEFFEEEEEHTYDYDIGEEEDSSRGGPENQ